MKKIQRHLLFRSITVLAGSLAFLSDADGLACKHTQPAFRGILATRPKQANPIHDSRMGIMSFWANRLIDDFILGPKPHKGTKHAAASEAFSLLFKATDNAVISEMVKTRTAPTVLANTCELFTAGLVAWKLAVDDKYPMGRLEQASTFLLDAATKFRSEGSERGKVLGNMSQLAEALCWKEVNPDLAATKLLQAFKTSIDRPENAVPALFHRAKILNSVGKRKEAKACYAEIVSRYPNSSDTRMYQLAMYHSR